MRIWIVAVVFVLASCNSSDNSPPPPPADTTRPVITLVGDDPQFVAVGDEYADPGANATDDKDGNLTGAITIDTSAIDSSMPGEYIVTYNVSDAAGNAATTATRTIIYEDRTSPNLILTGDDPQVIEAGDKYTELGASATDNVDGDLTAAISVDASAVNSMLPGEYTVVYEVSDAAGNESSVSRVVRVEDTIAPELTLLGDTLQTIIVGEAYTELGATASDNIDGVLTEEIVVNTAALDLSISGTYQVRYEVTDSSGNAATAIRTVRVLMTGEWTGILHANERGIGAVATFTLEDGRVLGVGNTIWIFDPDTDVFEALATQPYVGYTVTALLDGRILLAGLADYGYPTPGSDLAFIFDPAALSLYEVGSMQEARRGHTATLLENGQVLIVGGYREPTTSGSTEYLESAELFDPTTDTFTTTGPLASARHGHTATRLTDGTVLIAGGARDRASVLGSEIYVPTDRSFAAAAVMPGDGRWLHTANLLPSGKVLIAGGIPGWIDDFDPRDFQAGLIYEPADDKYVVVGGPDIQAINHFAASLPSTPDCPGPVVVGTGENGWKSVTNEVMIFDPVIEQFYPTAMIPDWRVGPVTAVLNDGRILVIGGGGYFGPTYGMNIFEPIGACN